MLEYYDGVLIMTTNRIETMDIAFQSRIHLAVKFDELNETYRRQIWKGLVNRMSADDEETRNELLEEDNLNILAQHPLNGRQIYNILNIAQSLARNRVYDGGR